jgi:hypothetical protein
MTAGRERNGLLKRKNRNRGLQTRKEREKSAILKRIKTIAVAIIKMVML